VENNRNNNYERFNVKISSYIQAVKYENFKLTKNLKNITTKKCSVNKNLTRAFSTDFRILNDWNAINKFIKLTLHFPETLAASLFEFYSKFYREISKKAQV
jgi:hypothetical protein